MDLATYKQEYEGRDDASPGWDAINGQLARVYGDREPENHWGTVIPYGLGGPDPIHGVSAFWRDEGYVHYISYGMSELWYNEDAVGGEFSQWGFEFTFRLALTAVELPTLEGEKWSAPIWPVNLMNNLARYVFERERWFEAGHFIPANGPIMADAGTELVGLLFVDDPELGGIETVHGHVDFLQMVGLTQTELDRLFSDEDCRSALIDAVSASDPLMVTNLSRTTPYF